jgi:hypothetical protein
VGLSKRARAKLEAATAAREVEKQEAPKRWRRNWVRTVCLVLGLALVMGLVVGQQQLRDLWVVYWINRDIEPFLAEPKVDLPPKGEPQPEPSIRGKVLPIDRTRRTVSDLYFKLPDNLRPDSAQEVGTIFWIDTTTTPIEGAKPPRIKVEYKFTLIDREASKVLARGAIRWLGPENTGWFGSWSSSPNDPSSKEAPLLEYLKNPSPSERRAHERQPLPSPPRGQ